MDHQAQPAPMPAPIMTLRERLDSTARLAARPELERWGERLEGSLSQLGETLRGHFRRDEDERLNEAFLGTFPRFEPKLRDLLSEHGVLLDRLEALRSRVRDLPGRDEPARRRLARDVGEFVIDLERHERAERAMLQDARRIDLGGEGD